MAPATCEEINDAACEASKVATEETENSREGKASTSSGTSLTTSGELKMTPMENLKTATILVGMGLAIFLGALDMNIVATAIPAITSDFNSSNDVGWYGSAYLLTLSASQLSWGKLYKAMPAKRVFVVALIVFEVGSLVCATAPNSAAFIVGRAIAGLGIAGVFSGALIIVSYTVPLRLRPLLNAVFAVLMGSTRATGTILGGAFTTDLTWRWAFYINLPFGGLTAFLILVGGKIKEPKEKPEKPGRSFVQEFDWLGFVLWVPTIICLLLLLQFGGTQYGWGDGPMIALYVITAIGFVAFVFCQKKLQERATIPPRIMKQRSMLFGAIYTFLAGGVSQLLQYFLPIFFQVVQGKSALGSGTAILSYILTFTGSLVLCGVAVSICGQYVPFMIAGSIIMAIGSGLISTLDSSTSRGVYSAYQIIAATGVGLGFDGPQLAAQTVFEQVDVPIALTIITSLMNLGGAIFVSVGSCILNGRATTLMRQSLPNDAASITQQTGLTDLISSLPPQDRPQAVAAFRTAFSDVVYFAAAAATLSFVAALGMEWKSMKSKDSKKADMEAKGENSEDTFPDNGSSSSRSDDDGSEKS